MIWPPICFCFSVRFGSFSRMNSSSSRMDISQNSLMFLSPTVTASTTGFRRRPWQSGHSTPDMKLPISSFIHSLLVSRKRRSRFSTMPSNVL